MIGVNRERLESLTQTRLAAECRKLSREWETKGRPDFEEMPRLMQVRYVALKLERERRGEQLRLF